jgi:DNA-binding CsgD family transcriptional regulator
MSVSSFVAMAVVTITCGPVMLDINLSIPLFLAGTFALITMGAFVINRILSIGRRYGQLRNTLFLLMTSSLLGLVFASVFLYLTIDLTFARALASVLLSVLLMLLNFGLLASIGSTGDKPEEQKVTTRKDPRKQKEPGAAANGPPGIEMIISSDRIIYLGRQYHLTPREIEIFELLIQGHSPQELSKMLFISLSTTRSHIKSIYSKTDVHSQLELIRKFMWLPPQC